MLMSVCSDDGWFTGRWTAFYQVYWPLLACTEISTINHCEWESEHGRGKFQEYRFQSFAVFLMLYSFFWEIPGVRILYADVSEHTSIFICADTTYEDGTDCGPKRRHVKFRRLGIIQKKVYKFQAFLCQHLPELIKITQTFVGMSRARVTAEIDPPTSLPLPHLRPFPIRPSKLAPPLRSSHLLAYFMFNLVPVTDLSFSSKITFIFCSSVTVALWLDSSGIISEHVICVFWWCLSLC
jgi:hypothetical protein